MVAYGFFGLLVQPWTAREILSQRERLCCDVMIESERERERERERESKQ